MPHELDARAAGFGERLAALIAARTAGEADLREAVAAILAEVAARGDAALVEFGRRFDRVELTPATLRVAPDEIAAARDAVDPATMAALELAAARIEAFHRRHLPENDRMTDAAGILLGHRWGPVDAVGIYVPGGGASYPSSVLMNAIPARIAGVARLVMTVPTPEGVLSPSVLAAAALAGVDEVWRVGGAQAIAALAFGTASIAPVDTVVGPGNAWVAEAKRQVYGRVGIDSIAGPSEILVVADAANDPEHIAADLLSQAEHGADSQAILVTDDAAFAGAVKAAVERHLETLPRAAIAAASWRDHGAVILVGAIGEDAPAIVDRLAPEHLELAVADPEALFARIRHAGAVFLGRHTPEALGDYVAGPNHVLPTSRTARFASGLTVADFMKRTTFVGCPPEGLAAIGPAAVRLARAEGLDAHALSVALRLGG